MHWDLLRFRTLVISMGVVFSMTGMLVAQQQPYNSNYHNNDYRRFTVDFGGGVTPTLGPTHRRLDTGWNMVGGGGINFTRHLGAEVQVMYNGFGVDQSVIKEFSVPAANSHLWGFTLDPRVRFGDTKRVGFYVIGGGGYYRRVINFTQPTTAFVSVFDPFFGFVTFAVPANVVIGTITNVGWGGNIGSGLTFRLGQGGAKFFVEARYHYVNTHPTETQVLPITVGFRW